MQHDNQGQPTGKTKKLSTIITVYLTLDVTPLLSTLLQLTLAVRGIILWR
jgi:hypothetical protein